MKQKKTINKSIFWFKRFSKKTYSAFNSLSRVVHICVATGYVLAVSPSIGVSAQTKSEQHKTLETEEHELEEVMVTASRIETPANQTAKQATLITKEQIEQAPVQSIQDLLVYIANIDVVQRGGHGVQSDISIRGGSKDQTAVLLNGINVSNAQTGHYSFDFPIIKGRTNRINIQQRQSHI